MGSVAGKLPNHQIVKRAARYAAKLFLAHWHSVYWVVFASVLGVSSLPKAVAFLPGVSLSDGLPHSGFGSHKQVS